MHDISCRCDECVVKLAPSGLVSRIVWRLGLHGLIEDSGEAEHKARCAVSRAILEHGVKDAR
jgi:hypothetical protein